MNCRQLVPFAIWTCFKDSLNWTNSFRINLNLIYNKADQALDLFYKTTEKDNKIPFNEEHDLSEILSF